MPEPKRVAWGYVTRGTGDGRELLVAERYKPEDPLRAGQLVIPGGALNSGESYEDAAVREVLEETGVRAYKPRLFVPPTENGRVLTFRTARFRITSSLENGQPISDMRVYYTDSGKSYEGMTFMLIPMDATQMPVENTQSDARQPRYMPLAEATARRGEFTPACQGLVYLFSLFGCTISGRVQPQLLEGEACQ